MKTKAFGQGFTLADYFSSASDIGLEPELLSGLNFAREAAWNLDLPELTGFSGLSSAREQAQLSAGFNVGDIGKESVGSGFNIGKTLTDIFKTGISSFAKYQMMKMGAGQGATQGQQAGTPTYGYSPPLLPTGQGQQGPDTKTFMIAGVVLAGLLLTTVMVKKK